MDMVRKIMATPDDGASGTELEESTMEEEVERKRKGSKPKRKSGGKSNKDENQEVNLLRKEIEEMKFYQELEQTEYQEMKEKMHNYEKQMKDIEKRKEKEDTRRTVKSSKPRTLQKIDEQSEFEASNVDTIDLIAGSSVAAPKSSKKMSESDKILQKKLKKRDAQIQALKSKLTEKVTSSKNSSEKLKSLAKEYEKRLNRMENLKDEEIQEIQDHYKGMMETLAKQVQKSNIRIQEEMEKNANIRSMMQEMRNDMTQREMELEKKIKSQQSSLKKNEVKLNKTESRLDRTGSKYSSLKNELDETLKANKEYAEKIEELEAKHLKEIKEREEEYEKREEEYEKREEEFEKELKELKESHEKEGAVLQRSVEEEISSLTGKIIDLEKLFENEADQHDQTAAKLEDLEAAMKEKEEEIKALTEKNDELEEKIEVQREELQAEVDRLEASASEKNGNHEKQITDMAKETIATTNDLKAANEKVFKLEHEIRLLNDDKLKKSKTLKKKALEIDDMQFRLNTINEAHLKEIKLRDIEHVKAKKKWSLSEQKLQKEIEELKEAQERYDHLEETASGNIVLARAEEEKKQLESQRKLIEHLKAEKASLQMTVASIEGKQNSEMLALQKELAKAKRALSKTSYERRLEKKMDQHHHEQEDEPSVQNSYYHDVSASNTMTDDESTAYENIQQQQPQQSREDIEADDRGNTEDKFTLDTQVSEISSTESTVPVTHSKTGAGKRAGITGQKSYRNYVRNRKFSKRTLSVGNE